MAKKNIKYADYSFDVDMDCFDDVRFFEIADTLETTPKNHIDILKMALGEDGYKKFADHFTKRDGRLKMTVVMETVAKIFDEADPKDSASGSSEKTTQKN